MTTASHATAGGRRRRRRSRRGRGAVSSIGLAAFLCLWVWIAHQSCRLGTERKAKSLLEREYPYPICRINTGDFSPFADDEPKTDFRQLRYGRLYTPVESANFSHATVHRNAFEQLARFPYLERLDFRDCQIDQDAVLWPGVNARLTNLEFWRTPISLEQLGCISTFAHLKYLVLDGAGLNGDWLRQVSALPRVEYLLLNNADLSDGATQSLARMKGVTWLQIPRAKIDSQLGPALASLERLECLVLDDTPFDDEGIKHLTTLKHLEQLSLAGTAITDGGMATVGTLLKLSRLSLNDTKVGDTGLRQLSQLRKLMGLDIIGTRATNSCLPTLTTMPLVKSVLVRNTRISTSAPGFVGVLKDDVWYPKVASAKEAEENSKGEAVWSK